jgi:hypothetical protein
MRRTGVFGNIHNPFFFPTPTPPKNSKLLGLLPLPLRDALQRTRRGEGARGIGLLFIFGQVYSSKSMIFTHLTHK